MVLFPKGRTGYRRQSAHFKRGLHSCPHTYTYSGGYITGNLVLDAASGFTEFDMDGHAQVTGAPADQVFDLTGIQT